MNTSFDIIDIIFTCLWSTLLLLLLATFIISITEKESRATKISILLFILFVPGLLISLLDIPFQNILELSIIGIAGVFLLLLILPINNFQKIKNYSFSSKVDERDIMFSRAELDLNGEMKLRKLLMISFDRTQVF